MFKPAKGSLAVFSHPNHEIAIYGLIKRMRPVVAFLTDGGGGARLAQSQEGMKAAGTREVSTFFNHSEDSFYNAFLKKDVAFYDRVAAQLADVIERTEPLQIYCDAVEYYNPIHDIALPITTLAARKAKCQATILGVPLVYQASGSPEQYVFQRALPGQRGMEHGISLEKREGDAKQQILKENYTALMAQMSFPKEVIEAACKMEYLVDAASPAGPVDAGCQVRYNRRGEEAKKGGAVQEAITYEGHFLPMVKELLA